MPTLAAVPAQRVTQQTTKRPAKHPVVVNEAPATVRLQIHPIQVHPDHHVLRITDQPSNVEYTIYTFHVNIQMQHLLAAPKLCYALNFYLSSSGLFKFCLIQFICSINQCAKKTRNEFILNVLVSDSVGLYRLIYHWSEPDSGNQIEITQEKFT